MDGVLLASATINFYYLAARPGYIAIRLIFYVNFCWLVAMMPYIKRCLVVTCWRLLYLCLWRLISGLFSGVGYPSGKNYPRGCGYGMNSLPECGYGCGCR